MNLQEAPPVIDGPATVAAALRWGLAAAVAQRARRIVCVDVDFAAWPLDDSELLAALTAWLRLPMRRLVMLARAYDAVPRRLPRYTAWRRDWSHAIDSRQVPDDWTGDLPTLLLSDGAVCVRLYDPVGGRGMATLDTRIASVAMVEIDAVLQRSVGAFAVDNLGL
ncbi:MAG: hypothetical protein KGL18_19955 [Burkholderiales bacterium]|nr:hypothetical protein [Burkholderiales bacterium]MDE1925970.1 hypothetical protein [Burkholderiales bacterium]MDE2159695.1 hypothetical protein [Burkholderiales bacterium]MDE2505244.1 hypothetical protein [Burkholderiales bacterium]